MGGGRGRERDLGLDPLGVGAGAALTLADLGGVLQESGGDGLGLQFFL